MSIKFYSVNQEVKQSVSNMTSSGNHSKMVGPICLLKMLKKVVLDEMVNQLFMTVKQFGS